MWGQPRLGDTISGATLALKKEKKKAISRIIKSYAQGNRNGSPMWPHNINQYYFTCPMIAIMFIFRDKQILTIYSPLSRTKAFIFLKNCTRKWNFNFYYLAIHWQYAQRYFAVEFYFYSNWNIAFGLNFTQEKHVRKLLGSSKASKNKYKCLFPARNKNLCDDQFLLGTRYRYPEPYYTENSTRTNRSIQ